MKYDRRAFRRLRRLRGLSIQEIARRTRLTARTVQYIEHGYSDPRATTLAKLAVALGVEVDCFFVRKDAA